MFFKKTVAALLTILIFTPLVQAAGVTDLTVDLVVHPPLVPPGGTVRGSITYENISSVPAQDVVLRIEGELGWSLANLILGEGAHPASIEEEGIIVIPLGELEPGEGGEITFSFEVPQAMRNGEAILVEASISTSSPEYQLDNNKDQSEVVVAAAELGVRVITRGVARSGEGTRVEVRLYNHGLKPAEHVYLVVNVESSLDWHLGNHEDLTSWSALSPQTGRQEEMTFYLGTMRPKSWNRFLFIFVPEEAPGEIVINARTGTSSWEGNYENNEWEEILEVDLHKVFLPFVVRSR